jgi:hypothetical protein
MNSRPPRTAIRKNVLFRVHLLIWGSLILGLLLLLAFGEIGLLVCLLLYLMAFILAGRMLFQEYGRSGRSWDASRTYLDRNLLFGIDAAAAATLLLGMVLETGAHSYGPVYGQLGFVLLVAAGTLWAAGLVWAAVSYLHTRDKFMLVFAFTFVWVSLVTAYGLLIAPPGFWAP